MTDTPDPTSRHHRGAAADALRKALDGPAHRTALERRTGLTIDEPEIRRGQSVEELDEKYAALLRVTGWTVHPPGEPCPRLAIVPGARSTDPSTSKRAAEAALPAARSVAVALLRCYRAEYLAESPRGLTSDEATFRAPEYLLGRHTVGGAWRRISELSRAGLIEASIYVGTSTPVVRKGKSGRDQTVYQITDAGLEYLRQLEPKLAKLDADARANVNLKRRRRAKR